jgi:hypothetical protein
MGENYSPVAVLMAKNRSNTPWESMGFRVFPMVFPGISHGFPMDFRCSEHGDVIGSATLAAPGRPLWRLRLGHDLPLGAAQG